MSIGPDFLCIGAEKAGTTWLYDNIRHQPEAWLPPPLYKELHYFDNHVPNKKLLHIGRTSHGGPLKSYSPLLGSPKLETFRWLWRYNHHGNDSMRWYRSLFTKEGKLCGDITPLYSTLDKRGVEYARRTVGDKCKVFIILRDPVSQAWSSIKMLYRYRNIDIRKDEEEAIIRELQRPFMALKTDYSRILELWSKYFDANNFKVFFYDDLVDNKVLFLGDVCRYIGIRDYQWTSPQLNKVSNKDNEKIPMSDSLTSSLSRLYLPELEKLSDMIDSHATSWLQKARESTS